MPKKPASLDELIAKRAEEFADQVKAAAAIADKEEEIRIEVEKQLAFIQRDAGFKLEAKHEFTVASGRVDSVYNRVIIEYKNPSSPAARIGPGPSSPGAKKVVEQIKSRFYDLRSKETLNTLFGVGCDGKHFIFIRFYNDKWYVEDPVEVNKASAERFLTALFNFGRGAKRFEADFLASDFGALEGSIASSGIGALYQAICATDNPKALVFLSQWKILFGEVCGYDVDNPSDKIKKLAEFYDVPLKNLKPAELLFSVHSYYALLMKLLAGEIIGHFHNLPSLIQKVGAAPSSAKLKSVLENLEAGGIFGQLGITNFLEGDLFAWYLPAWSDPIEDLVRKMAARLVGYNPMTLKEKPAEARDLLKKLYQQLFPKSIRHDLGEYYTPDWLAEHVLNELGYVGDPDKRILDPACGSGTFLVMAINRIRSWYEANREKCRYDEGELCKKILANVVGFDLNPLAVMAARTNYLIAIRDLVSHVDKIEIPVYLCDSILTPSSYGGLFAGSTDAVKELKTSAAKFLIPTEIATNREDVTKYAEQLEICIRNGSEPHEFVERCQDEGLTITAKSLHTDLYKELVKLDKANKNGVWARIIKNSFAPLFVGRVDYVAGNPPWVNWESLPEEYRNQSLPIWNHYGLKDTSFGRSAIGKSKHELAALFVFAASDNYLAPGGRLGFVITQSLFKNKGAGGFRLLAYAKTTLCPVSITDMVECGIFEGAINRTATLAVEKSNKPIIFPLPYTAWFPVGDPDIPESASLDAAKQLVKCVPMVATPSETGVATSPWMTCPKAVSGSLYKVLGRAFFRAYEGVNSGGLVGAFRVRKLKPIGRTHTLIENLGEGKVKIEIVTHQVENEILYPFLRGRDVQRWNGRESCSYILTHDAEHRRPYSIAEMRAHFPKALEYLTKFKRELQARKSAPVRQQMESGAFYALLGVGPYTVAEWKVLFKDLTEFFQCCVVGPKNSSDSERPLVPDYTLRMIPAESEDEAHYIAALLNSAPSVSVLYYSSAGVQTQRYHAADAEKIAVPKFTGQKAQKELASLSKECHDACAREDWKRLLELERRVDNCAGDFWGLSVNDVESIDAAMSAVRADWRRPRRAEPAAVTVDGANG